MIQLQSTRCLGENLDNIGRFCREAKDGGAHWVALPENALFLGREGEASQYAEALDASKLVAELQTLARSCEVWLFAGSVPERSPDERRAYNTSVVIAPEGTISASYRKVHLFDVELPGGGSIRESDGWAAGDDAVVVSVGEWQLGLSICYDLRFPEHYRRLVDRGASVVMVPSAFTLQTGKDHWECLLRARAIENQCYVVAAAQWGEHFPGRVSWGKSMVIDPWGTILASAPERPGVIFADLDHDALVSVRRRFPALTHRREDLNEED